MRSLVFLLFAITMSGCSGMMMSGSSSSGSTAQSERAARIQASQDAAINDRIKQEFAADSVLRDARVYVNCKNGMVRLSGSVPSYRAREDAEKLAISIDGVKSVDNKITVEFSN